MAKVLEDSDVRGFVPPRAAASRKGDNGIALVVGGSYVYHGAPILSSLAALRSGTDLVYTAVPKANAAPARAASPNLIVIPLADQKLTLGAAKKLVGALPRNLGSAAVGMGLAVADRAALVHLIRSLLDRDVRLSLDAGALVPEVLPHISGANVAVTPHAGEFARLFGGALPDGGDGRVRAAESRAREFGVTVLLKGQADIITDGSDTYLCKGGSPAMTVGGTGDVLSGLVAGMMSRNRSALESAAAAAFVNGRAGTYAHMRLGYHLMATDLIDEIPAAMRPFDGVA